MLPSLAAFSQSSDDVLPPGPLQAELGGVKFEVPRLFLVSHYVARQTEPWTLSPLEIAFWISDRKPPAKMPLELAFLQPEFWPQEADRPRGGATPGFPGQCPGATAQTGTGRQVGASVRNGRCDLEQRPLAWRGDSHLRLRPPIPRVQAQGLSRQDVFQDVHRRRRRRFPRFIWLRVGRKRHRRRPTGGWMLGPKRTGCRSISSFPDKRFIDGARSSMPPLRSCAHGG